MLAKNKWHKTANDHFYFFVDPTRFYNHGPCSKESPKSDEEVYNRSMVVLMTVGDICLDC